MGVIKKAAKSVGKLFGYDSDAIAAAGKAQAEATTKAASDQATSMREQASQAQHSQETLAAQRQAADAAAELLNTPSAQADVNIASGGEDDNIDPVSGKRLKPRDAYSAASINI